MSIIRLNPTRWPYSVAQLRQDEPSASISIDPSDDELAAYDCFRVQPTAPPVVSDPATHVAEEVMPLTDDGRPYLQRWAIREMTTEEQDAYYRATHPPQWLEFGAAVQADPQINGVLSVTLEVKPGLAMALPVGLGKAADGDPRVFLQAWSNARANGLVSQELAQAMAQQAQSFDLPPEFVAGLTA